MMTVFNGLLDRNAAAISRPINAVRQLAEKSNDASDDNWLTTFVLIVILLTVFAAVMFVAAIRFRHIAQQQADALFSKAKTENTISAEKAASLPRVVQRWLQRADVIGKSTPNRLIIRQRGTLRTKPERKWMPFESTQYFTIDPPGFVWIASIHIGSLLRIGGRDTYRDGHGNMIIKPLYLFNAADGWGKEVDQGTLVRYLAEMAWFPHAAASQFLRWQSINETQAYVTMEYRGVSASGVFTFNDDGDAISFEAKRYGEFGGIYRKERWSVKTTSFATIGGTRIGNRNEVTWRLPEGDFHWLNMEVTDITRA